MFNKFSKNFLIFKNNSIIQLLHQIYLAEIRGNVQLAKQLQIFLLKHPVLKLELLNMQLKLSLNQDLKTSNKIKNLPLFFNVQKEIEASLIQKTIEPVWEARFSPTSYGARPGRCCYDPILKIKKNLSNNSAYFYKFNFRFDLNKHASFPVNFKGVQQSYDLNNLIQEKNMDFQKLYFVSLNKVKKTMSFLKKVLFFSLEKNFKYQQKSTLNSFITKDKIIKQTFFQISKSSNFCKFSKRIKNNLNLIFQSQELIKKTKLIKSNESNLLRKLENLFPKVYLNICFEILESELINSTFLISHQYFLENKEQLNSFHQSLFQSNKHFENELELIRFGTDLVLLNSNSNILTAFSNVVQRNFEKIPCFSLIKTEIGHTFLPFEKKIPGLNFLNFEISQIIKESNQISNRNKSSSRKQNEVVYLSKKLSTHISPSQFALKEHITELKVIIKTFSSQTQEKLIYKLTPKIRFWSNYFKISTSKKSYLLCDFFLLRILWRWACRRHSKKSRQWIREKYFHRIQEKNWQFAVFLKDTESFLCLPHHAETNLISYNKINDEVSPYLI